MELLFFTYCSCLSALLAARCGVWGDLFRYYSSALHQPDVNKAASDPVVMRLCGSLSFDAAMVELSLSRGGAAFP